MESTRKVLCMRGSRCEISGSTQTMLHAGVLPAPDEARPMKNKFLFSFRESNSFTVVSPMRAPVHGSIPANSNSCEVPRLLANVSSQAWMFCRATSSHGILTCPSLLSKSTTDWMSSKELMFIQIFVDSYTEVKPKKVTSQVPHHASDSTKRNTLKARCFAFHVLFSCIALFDWLLENTGSPNISIFSKHTDTGNEPVCRSDSVVPHQHQSSSISS